MVPFVVGFIVGLYPTILGIVLAFVIGLLLHIMMTLHLLSKDGYDIRKDLPSNPGLFAEYSKRATHGWIRTIVFAALGAILDIYVGSILL